MRLEDSLRARMTRVEVRLPAWMAGLTVSIVIVGLTTGHTKLALGFGAGSAASILGYIWLQGVVAAALSQDPNRVRKRLVFKLIIRYPLLLGTLYLFYRTKWLPLEAVLAGLFVPLAGAVVECLYQVGGFLLPSLIRFK